MNIYLFKFFKDDKRPLLLLYLSIYLFNIYIYLNYKLRFRLIIRIAFLFLECDNIFSIWIFFWKIWNIFVDSKTSWGAIHIKWDANSMDETSACHMPRFLHANTAKANSRVILIGGLFDLGYRGLLCDETTNYRILVLNLLFDSSKTGIFYNMIFQNNSIYFLNLKSFFFYEI